MSRSPSPELIETLRRQIARLENGRRTSEPGVVSCGCRELDRLLPGGGFRRGSLVEWLVAEEGCGAQSLALLVAREACRGRGGLVVFDRSERFYPPAAARMGIEPADLLVVRPASQDDELWALAQVLHCPGVAAAVAEVDCLQGRDFRRLQLAAETQGVLGLLLRPWGAGKEPSWADVRLGVEPLPSSGSAEVRRLKIHLLRSRRGAGYGTIEVELHEEAHPVHLVARLAAATADARSERAV
ncbi:MAG: ImuA family protein [Thermoguttaceae bacterium]